MSSEMDLELPHESKEKPISPDELAGTLFDEEETHLDERKKSSLKTDIRLAYETVGVVFGSIATSPLYIFSTLPFQGRTPEQEDYLGIFSIMFWTLTLIGIVKYGLIALNADDHGEGGTFALYSKLSKQIDLRILSKGPKFNKERLNVCKGGLENFIERSMAARRVLLFVAILGMCMLIGDGVLTPAISVLSAMDGLKGPFPSINKDIVEILSAVILVALFLVQRFGAARVSFMFSPIMVCWALSIPMIGLYHICRHNLTIFKALSPYYIIRFFLRNGKEGWHLLGSIVIVITGSEAMFADLGHFNKRSMRIAFICVIYPSLVLTYAGQSTYLLTHLNEYGNGFYAFIPHSIYWPMFVIATLVAIVASQSLILAAFSVIKQSVVLDYFPRVTIVHTSNSKEGQVYSPEINYILLILCVVVVLGFGDVNAIGNAYGLVVIFVMLITTALLTIVMIVIWKTPLYLALLFFIPFFCLESVYLSAVLIKFLSGGWFPFAISIVLAVIMFSWYYGRQKKLEYEETRKLTYDDLHSLFVRPDIQRVQGMCIFYSRIQEGLTPVFGHYTRNMHSIHKVIIFVTLNYKMVPKVEPEKRIVCKRMGPSGSYCCLVQYGYDDKLNPNGNDFTTLVVDALIAYIKQGTYVESFSSMSLEEEVNQIEEAKRISVVQVVGKTRFKISKKTGWFSRVLLSFYQFLHSNCRSAMPTLDIPLEQRMEIGMFYNV